MKRALLAFGLLGLSACGPTIGDPCTTGQDCGPGVCVNRDFAPGGYCSKNCASGCPAGTICVANVLGDGNSGCMRACKQATTDCRPGYLCAVVGHSATAVCIGPAGL